MNKRYRVETYLPKEALDDILQAIYSLGLGKIGEYDCCFSYYEVHSSWRPLDNATPYRGKVGEIESAIEYKLEFVCDEKDINSAVETIKSHHPYEEVCINVFPMFAC